MVFQKFFESVVYSYKYKPGTQVLPVFDDSNELTLSGCSYDDFCLYYTSPILNFRSASVFSGGSRRQTGLCRLRPMLDPPLVLKSFEANC